MASCGMWVGDVPPTEIGCDPAECTDRVGGEHAPSCDLEANALDRLPADVDAVDELPGACVGSGQSSFGPELRQPCPVCGRLVSTVPLGMARALVAHVAPTISPTGEAPSVSLDL